MEIKRGIPIPEPLKQAKGNSKYPLLDMEISDCLIFKTKKEAKNCLAASWALKRRYENINNWNFIYRQISDCEFGVWRVDPINNEEGDDE